MKIRLVSDLHLEFATSATAERVLGEVFAAPADVFVIAGDLSAQIRLDACLDLVGRLRPAGAPVLYVLGNHEYYSEPLLWPQEVEAKARAVCEANGITLLDNEAVEIGGVRFVGTSLWFPRTPWADLYAGSLNDFRNIRGFRSWYEGRHRAAREYLEANLRPGDVLITHHLPVLTGVMGPFTPQQTAFLGDPSLVHLALACGLRACLAGHLHRPMRLELGRKCFLALNPRGYPFSVSPAYDPCFTLEIS